VFAALLLSATASSLYAVTIRVLLVYDTTAKTWVDSNGGMNLFAADAVAKMTQAAVNSGINLTFELAGATNFTYTYSSFSEALTDLKNGTGSLAVAHQLRDVYGADLVAMLVDTGSAYGTVGLGYLLNTLSGSPNYAFCVCAIRSVNQSQTLTHEVGHNLGCHHSKYQTSDHGPNTSLNSYSAGWYFTGNNSVKYHTIMAYNDDGYGNYYYECPQFSSPLVTYLGVVAGDAADGDNARTIRETMGVVEAYRAAVAVPTVTLSLTGSPMAEAGGAATVTATLSATYPQPVTVNLTFSGAATVSSDYTCSGTNVVIAVGGTTGSITLTAVQDAVYEEAETIVVDISSLVNGTESGTQQVTATITDDDPMMGVAPSGGVAFSGLAGDVVSPSNQVYVLTNAGAGTISWTATRTNSWVLLSATNGTLSAGGTTNVTVSINSDALEDGNYSDTVTFSNTTQGVGTSRAVSLTITPVYIYFFPLDTDPGWLIGSTNFGQWAFGHPTGQGGTVGYADPVNGATGTNVFGVNLNGNYSITNSGPYYLTVGPFDFSGYTNVSLLFQRWLNTDNQYWTPATVDISIDGTTWDQVDNSESRSTSWTSYKRSISGVADRQTTVYIRWGYAVLSSSAWPESGWNIDDIGFTGDAVSSPDTDGDGIPNEWELQYFGGETNANPSAFASNGVNTILEAYVAGLNPTNPGSFFGITFFDPATNGFVVGWDTTSGRVYSVNWAPGLTNSFQTLETNIVWPQASYTDTVHDVDSRSFYQINVRLAP
jgi:hypothetical protein